MPLDFTMLLGTSPPASTFVPYGAVPSPYDDCGGLLVDAESPYACRRVATFPMVNRHAPKPSSLKYRSLSETDSLSEKINGTWTLADFKRELNTLLEDEQHGNFYLPHHNGEGDSDEEKSSKSQPDSGREIRSSPASIFGEDDHVNELSEAQKTDAKPSLKSARKKVSFADERGCLLATVRLMTEPSDVPPKISASIIKALLGDQWRDDDAEAKPCATWLINFKQPASEYLQFRHKLDTNFVAVENVVVKNDQCRIMGTVKVKNISYEKDVFVRLTDNEWKSYYDRPCKFMPSRGADAYDTFQFDFEIPCDDSQRQRLEFCVCYKTTNNGHEYWDSNGGKNFEIISEQLRLQRTQTQTANAQQAQANEKKKNHYNSQCKSVADALALECSNWTEFASWSDLSTDGPYW